jgi:serine O-acetyltransferase
MEISMFKYLREDIQAVKDNDPAAVSTLGILLNYPGVQATCAHRNEHWLWLHGRHGIARFLSQVTRFFTGIEIHPGAKLGRRVFIDHGMGVIIGETAEVGDDVTLYQGVTLGGTGKETGKRHPNIGKGAVIGVGAAVLGNVTIGAHSKVGGGAVVVDNVPPDSTVVGIPGHVVSQNGIRICPADPDRRDLLPDPVQSHLVYLDRRMRELESRLANWDGGLTTLEERLSGGKKGQQSQLDQPEVTVADTLGSSFDEQKVTDWGDFFYGGGI